MIENPFALYFLKYDVAAALSQILGKHAGQGLGINLDDGKTISGKIFAGNLGSVISKFGEQTNITNDHVSNLLGSTAPNRFSVLGKGTNTGNIGNTAGGLLGGDTSCSNTSSNTGGLLGGLLGKMFKK